MKVPTHKPFDINDFFQPTPMADIGFNLVIFFIMAAQFALIERDFGLGYQGPALAQGAKAEDFPTAITIQLRREGAGVAITVGQAKLPANDFAGIRARLTHINLPHIGVVVQAEPQLSVDEVAQALDAVLASPMKDVSVAKLTAATAGAALPEGTRVVTGPDARGTP